MSRTIHDLNQPILESTSTHFKLNLDESKNNSNIIPEAIRTYAEKIENR